MLNRGEGTGWSLKLTEGWGLRSMGCAWKMVAAVVWDNPQRPRGLTRRPWSRVRVGTGTGRDVHETKGWAGIPQRDTGSQKL